MKRIRILNFDANNHCNGCNGGDYDLRLHLEVEFCNDREDSSSSQCGDHTMHILIQYICIPPTTVLETPSPTTVCAR